MAEVQPRFSHMKFNHDWPHCRHACCVRVFFLQQARNRKKGRVRVGWRQACSTCRECDHFLAAAPVGSATILPAAGERPLICGAWRECDHSACRGTRRRGRSITCSSSFNSSSSSSSSFSSSSDSSSSSSSSSCRKRDHSVARRGMSRARADKPPLALAHAARATITHHPLV